VVARGFAPLPAYGSTFTAVVSEVAADHLVLQRAGGDTVTFGWTGPSLATEFSVAETVSCELTTNRWHIVKGTRRTAEIHLETSNTGISNSGTIPGVGSYALETECANVTAPFCTGATTPVVQAYSRVVASLGADSVSIPMQTTASLGPWQVTNILHRLGYGGNSGQCHTDFINEGQMSALGPP
jgi:hypothetical protein